MLGDLILCVRRALAVTLGMGKVPFPVLLWLCFSETLPNAGLNMLQFSLGMKCKKAKMYMGKVGKGKRTGSIQQK